MPGSAKELKRYEDMLDELMDMYPEIEDEALNLKSSLAGAGEVGEEDVEDEEMPAEDEAMELEDADAMDLEADDEMDLEDDEMDLEDEEMDLDDEEEFDVEAAKEGIEGLDLGVDFDESVLPRKKRQKNSKKKY